MGADRYPAQRGPGTSFTAGVDRRRALCADGKFRLVRVIEDDLDCVLAFRGGRTRLLKFRNVIARQILSHSIALPDATRPWSVARKYKRATEPYWSEYVCDEGNQQVLVGKENYMISADGYLMPVKKDQSPPDLKYFNQTRQ